MTTSVREVREAVAAVLETIDGLNVSAFPTFALSTPHAVVKEAELNYRQTFGTTLHEFGLSIIVFCSVVDEQASQYYLDDLAEIEGPKSIRELIEGDSTLEALADFVAVNEASAVQIRASAPDPNILYLTREWTCRVNVSNT